MPNTNYDKYLEKFYKLQGLAEAAIPKLTAAKTVPNLPDGLVKDFDLMLSTSRHISRQTPVEKHAGLSEGIATLGNLLVAFDSAIDSAVTHAASYYQEHCTGSNPQATTHYKLVMAGINAAQMLDSADKRHLLDIERGDSRAR